MNRIEQLIETTITLNIKVDQVRVEVKLPVNNAELNTLTDNELINRAVLRLERINPKDIRNNVSIHRPGNLSEIFIG